MCPKYVYAMEMSKLVHDQSLYYCHIFVIMILIGWLFNTLRPKQNGRHFPNDIFKCIFLNENVWISIKISLKSVCKGPVNNIPVCIQIMAWHHPGDKPLSEPVMVSLLTHICITQPHWSTSWGLNKNGCNCAGDILKCIFFNENFFLFFFSWNGD